MQVVLHAGAHMTDEDRLLNCLVANREKLSSEGTGVPSPSTYRKLIRDMIQSAQNDGITEHARNRLFDAVLGEGTVNRLVLSSAGFFGTPKMAAAGGVLYSTAESRLSSFRHLFLDHEVELFLALRNPATFLPAMFEKTKFDSFADFMHGTDPATIRWSDMITRICADHPDLPITIWCNEDTPLIWAQILREMAGLGPEVAIEGEFTLMAEIMSASGMQRFQAYLASHPDMTEEQKRRVVAAFLDKFAEDDAIEEELDVPGWTDDLVDELTNLYDEDLLVIQRMPGVNVITP